MPMHIRIVSGPQAPTQSPRNRWLDGSLIVALILVIIVVGFTVFGDRLTSNTPISTSDDGCTIVDLNDSSTRPC